jgi:hypothetical protein
MQAEPLPLGDGIEHSATPSLFPLASIRRLPRRAVRLPRRPLHHDITGHFQVLDEMVRRDRRRQSIGMAKPPLPVEVQGIFDGLSHIVRISGPEPFKFVWHGIELISALPYTKSSISRRTITTY